MRPLLVLDVVGLTAAQIGARTPHIAELVRGGALAPMTAVVPAVTLSAQATMLTGLSPSQHGAVGNGWYWPELGEVLFWRQPNANVRGEKVYERARRLDPSFTCAKLFWWWNLGAAVDWSITPRPYYPADGRKIPATYAQPHAYGERLERELGAFPFFDFWGPRSGLPSSRWIARATISTLAHERPTLALAYLPHLDYSHQRHGPQDERSLAALQEVDALVGELHRAARQHGYRTLVLSEYGIEAVDQPVHLNRVLRTAGLLRVRATPTGEVLDPIASDAFAVSDHQVAHIVLRDPEQAPRVASLLRGVPGVARVLCGAQRAELGLDHPHAGELVAIAARGAWFTYYYWLEDAAAPDFARTVDIHRKPGYDPCELFLDPQLRWPKLRIAWRLLQKKLGQRALLDVIPLDASLVRGSHGRPPDAPEHGPVFACSAPFGDCGPVPRDGTVAMESVPDRIIALLAAG